MTRMRKAILLLLAGLTGPTLASEPESWSFVYVVRSSDLVSTGGRGELTRRGSQLSGTLSGDNTVSYQIQIDLRREVVSATFWPHESDSGVSDLKGTFHQDRVSRECWQTIQLQNGTESVVLARNAPRCWP